MLNTLYRLTLICLITISSAKANIIFQEDFSAGFNDWSGLIAVPGAQATVAPDDVSLFSIKAEQAIIGIETDLTFAALTREIVLPSTAGATLKLSLDFIWQTPQDEDVIFMLLQTATGDEIDLLAGLDVTNPATFTSPVALTNIDITALAGQTTILLLGIGDFDTAAGPPFDQLTLDNIVIEQQLAQAVGTPAVLALMMSGFLVFVAKRRKQ